MSKQKPESALIPVLLFAWLVIYLLGSDPSIVGPF